MSEANETDLFPWILGGILLVLAGIVTTLAVGSTSEGAATASEAVASEAVARDAIAGKPAVTAAQSGAATPVVPGVPLVATRAAALTPPPLPEGQVWQCLVAGQRIFSDAPCGADAAIRQLNPVNRMAPTPVVPARITASDYYRNAPPADGSAADEPAPEATAVPGYDPPLVYVLGAPHRHGRWPSRHQPHRSHGTQR